MKQRPSYRGNYILGHFVKVGDPNGEVWSSNPGDLDQERISVPFSYEAIHEAVLAGRRAFPAWKRLPAGERHAVLKRYSEKLTKASEEIASLMSWEVGKPLWEAREEIAATVRLIDEFLEFSPASSYEVDLEGGDKGVVRFHSRGVMAVLGPASEPLLVSHAHFIPNLLYGNTVVMKGPRLAPLVAQKIAETFHESNLPAGVFNLVHGDAEVGRRLIAHADLSGVFFTGSYETGFKIRKQVLSDFQKIVVLETGGKNAAVIWEDCDFQRALHEAVYAAFITTGQRCSSTSRLLIHASLFDRFLSGFHALSKKLRIGYALEDEAKAPFMGPLLSDEGVENYLRYQGIAIREGAEEIMRGKLLERDKRGYYVSPSIHLVEVPDAKSVYQKNEVYGPNVACFKVSDLDEAIHVLNQPQHGLSAAFYSASRETFLKAADEVRVGAFHWNQPTTRRSWRLPHGGIKKSGNARPMGSFASHQCLYPVSSVERSTDTAPDDLPASLPRSESL